jgi:hypothetical protein
MPRIGSMLLVLGLLTVPAVMTGEAGGTPPAAAGALCPAPPASFLTPPPSVPLICFQCGMNDITGPTEPAIGGTCSAAATALDSALRSAAAADCRNRGYDRYCPTTFTEVVTSPCTDSGGVWSVAGHAVYDCARNIC